MHIPENSGARQESAAPDPANAMVAAGLARVTAERRAVTFVDRIRALQSYVPEALPTDIPYDDDPVAYVDAVRQSVLVDKYGTDIFHGRNYHRNRLKEVVNYELSRPLSSVIEDWRDKHRPDIERICQAGNFKMPVFDQHFWPFLPTSVRAIARAPRIQADMRADRYRDFIFQGLPTKNEELDPMLKREGLRSRILILPRHISRTLIIQ